MRAEGREHAGQQANPQPDHQDVPVMSLPHPNDGQAMRNYTERYEYDGVGNIQAMIHAATNGNWTRRYQYAEDSNRLLATSRPGDGDGEFSAAYTYDTHGNMTTMPHLPLMRWDDRDRLKATSRQVVNEGTPETTYYVYDGSGQRVRKVTERQAAVGETSTRKNERIYLGGFEIYREYSGDGNTISLERETLHVMDDRQRIALVETKTVDTENSSETPLLAPIIRYQLGNHLGSVSLEVDGVGAVISYEEYHPYGTTAYRSRRTTPEVSLKRYRYTGMERDEETGLAYHGARYYALWLGRWISTDPIGVKEDINLYQYVGNSSINAVDKSGFHKVYVDSVNNENKTANITIKLTYFVVTEGEGAVPNSERFNDSRFVKSLNQIFGEQQFKVKQLPRKPAAKQSGSHVPLYIDTGRKIEPIEREDQDGWTVNINYKVTVDAISGVTEKEIQDFIQSEGEDGQKYGIIKFKDDAAHFVKTGTNLEGKEETLPIEAEGYVNEEEGQNDNTIFLSPQKFGKNKKNSYSEVAKIIAHEAGHNMSLYHGFGLSAYKVKGLMNSRPSKATQSDTLKIINNRLDLLEKLEKPPLHLEWFKFLIWKSENNKK
jgi:RHS repeat-associated protein